MHYGADLTYIHDAGFTEFIRAAGPAVLELFRERGITSGKVVDLGCGGGVWAAQLVAVGYDVVGVDLSAEMVELARTRAPNAEFVCASFLDADLPDCAAVTALGEVLNYVMDERVGEDALAALFARVHAALRSGGVFVFDIATPGRCTQGQSTRCWVEDDWAMFLKTTKDSAAAELTREMTVFRKVGEPSRRGEDLYRRSVETHRLRLYDPPAIEARLRDAGFDVQLLPTYGDYNMPAGLCVFVAAKRGG